MQEQLSIPSVQNIFEKGEMLTIEKAKSLIGKTIAWSAPVYKHNSSFVGVSTIQSVSDERNCLTALNHTDSNLEFAFLPFHHWSKESIKEMEEKCPNQKEVFTALNYSDADREIYFVIFE